ncbi:nucleotidyltransferase domain-containing protein [Candidatus Parcubacteria bacterium]|nr:nucleotidyltransferase domain-containing protein [Candidatus Parcubacteria bacterium]
MKEKEEIKKKIFDAVVSDPLRAKIKKVSLFGSYLNENQKEDSDVDIIVEFNPLAQIGFFDIVKMKKRMKEKTGKEVDILTPSSISKFFRDEIINKMEMIYG